MFGELHILVNPPPLKVLGYTHQGIMTPFGKKMEAHSILDPARSPSSLGSVTFGNECFH